MTYKSKTPLNKIITFRAKVAHFSDRKIEVHGECWRADDPEKKILVEAVGIYIPRTIKSESAGPPASKL